MDGKIDRDRQIERQLQEGIEGGGGKHCSARHDTLTIHENRVH